MRFADQIPKFEEFFMILTECRKIRIEEADSINGSAYIFLINPTNMQVSQTTQLAQGTRTSEENEQRGNSKKNLFSILGI